jgi:Protein of unknown function (DUF4236)
MGFFRFRRTFKIAPGVRFNLSKSGASVSFGPRGLHYTVGPKGTRTTVGLPGSGISWTEYQPYSSRRGSEDSNDPPPHATDANTPSGIDDPVTSNRNATILESAPIEQLVAKSTIEIAHILSANHARWRSRKALLAVLAIVFLAGIIVSANAAGSILQSAIILMIVGASMIWLAAALYGRQSLIVSLEYDLSDEEIKPFNRLARAFNTIASCECVWQIPIERLQTDWKRNAGASITVERKRISLGTGHPPLIKSNIDFLLLPLANERIYFTPDAILIVAGNSVAALRYDELEIVCRPTSFIEDGRPPSDAQAVGESWRYVNRDGGPDRRFGNNRKLPICLYAEIDLKSGTGLNDRINCSRLNGAEEFVASAVALRSKNTAGSPDHPSADAKPPPLPVEPARNAKGSNLNTAYAKESETARALVLEHGKLWEFLLIEELLRSKLQALKSECDQFDELLRSAPRKRFSGPEFMNWLSSEMDELVSTIAKIVTCVEKELTASLGEPGVSGDEIKMLNAVNALFGHCRRFLIFELVLCAADIPSEFHVLKAAFRGIRLTAVCFVEELRDEWSRNVEALRKGSHNFELKVTFSAPPQLQKASEEIEQISKNPKLLQ